MDQVIQSSDDDSFISDETDEYGNKLDNGNPQLADALSKVIRMSKNNKGKSIVLSKAKLYAPKTPDCKKSYNFEIEPDINVVNKVKTPQIDHEEEEDVKPDKRVLNKLALKRKEKLQRGRLKPSALDRDKERPLVKIATKGVVQLFNAISHQQSVINKQINQPGVTEGKKEKVMKSIDKNAFIDVLRGNNLNKTDTTQWSTCDEQMKIEPTDEEQPWQVLRDDFMISAKLKDWDKKEIEEED